MLLNVLQCTGQAPAIKNYQEQNICSKKVEKSRYRDRTMQHRGISLLLVRLGAHRHCSYVIGSCVQCLVKGLSTESWVLLCSGLTDLAIVEPLKTHFLTWTKRARQPERGKTTQ